MSKTQIPRGGITADAIDATLIADDAVSEEHIDTTAITANTEKSTLVDADKFLISDSAASGALKYVQKSNVSSAAILTQVGALEVTSSQGALSIPSCFTSTYLKYFILFDRIQVDSNGADFRMQWHYGDSSSNDSQYHHYSALHRYPSTTDAWSAVNAGEVKLGQAQKSGAGNFINGFMYMYHPLSTTDGTTNGVWHMQNNSNNGAGSAVTVGSFGTGDSGSNSAYTGFQLYASTGDIKGNITVYGIKNSS